MKFPPISIKTFPDTVQVKLSPLVLIWMVSPTSKDFDEPSSQELVASARWNSSTGLLLIPYLRMIPTMTPVECHHISELMLR